jgi:hypothetical protein
MLPLLFALSQSAVAAPCLCESQRARFEAFADKLASQPTLEASQDMALDKIKMARQVVHFGAKQLGNDPAIAEATQKVDALDAQVRAAQSQQEVSIAFSQVAHPTEGGCEYTAGEVVIIVIGFLFAILPGILFLFLLC